MQGSKSKVPAQRVIGASKWSVLLLAAMLGGCGYTHQAMFPEDVGSVAVDIFANRTFYQGVEFDVTEAVIKEIELQTPYKVVPGDTADTALHATITRVQQHRLSRRRLGGLVQEMELQIRVNFEWQDLRTGKTLRQRRGLKSTGRYIPAVATGETFKTAQHEAAQRMARQIVAVMASQW